MATFVQENALTEYTLNYFIMKEKIILSLLMILFCRTTNAQYVTIPDTNFVSALHAIMPSCMNGNQLDTTCALVTQLGGQSFNNKGIANFDGIQYFDSCDVLDINFNPTTLIPALPPRLVRLYCVGGLITSLPDLPSTLLEINVSDNQLTSLPALPLSLDIFSCSRNQLTALPNIPASTFIFNCDSNFITSLPVMNLPPVSNFSYNLISDISNLTFNHLMTANWVNIFFNHNQINCLPTLPNRPSSPSYPTGLLLDFTGNPLTCLPNYTWNMDSAMLSLPLCQPNDVLNNPNNCNVLQGVVGRVYVDVNSNCNFDSSDSYMQNIPVKILDASNNLLQLCTSFSNGVFNFALDTGTYKITLDTVNMPFDINCIYPGVDTIVNITNQNTIASGLNFEATFNSGFDLGVTSVVKQGWVFPGNTHTVMAQAGDIFQFYNFPASNGLMGSVQISVSGPATYYGNFGPFSPDTIIGNTAIFTVSDFGSLNTYFGNGLGLELLTDSTAQIGDSVCIDVTVSLLQGDLNPSNNTLQYCYAVSNSYDPNNKEVSHSIITEGFNDWINYTIHFQNTGNAPAQNIVVVDTLSSNHDFSTFQLVNYSHENTTMLRNGTVSFNFPQIMLPDSTSDFYGSMGFVQFKIKSLSGLPASTLIENTAHIFFDFNSPITTNTVSTLVVRNPTGVANVFIDDMEVSVYPNPVTNELNIILPEENKMTFQIFDVAGKAIVYKNINKTSVIKLKDLANGIYVYRITSYNGEFATGKLIKK